MARINIEDKLFLDPRFEILKKLLGSEALAIGTVVQFWRCMQNLFKEDRQLSEEIFTNLFPVELIKSGLAMRVDNGFIRAAGDEEHFSWLKERVEAGKVGGRHSGITRRSKNNNLTEANAKQNEANVKQTQANAKPLTLTPPLTLTLKKEELNTVCSEANFVRSKLAMELVTIDEEANSLARMVKSQVQEAWLKLYPDSDWIKRELIKAKSWIAMNPQKAPKSRYGQFLSSWLERGWERQRKTYSTNKSNPKVATKEINFEEKKND